MTEEGPTFQERLAEQMKTFRRDGGSFSGDGWKLIREKVEEHQHILIGEDHFSREIPQFVEAVADLTKFDTFYIEIDTYSTKLIEESFSKSDEERLQFNEKYQDLFSFYALAPEYRLLEKMMKYGAKLLGADQVIGNADRLLADHLAGKVANQQAVEILEKVSRSSKAGQEKFLQTKDFGAMYMMTDEFDEDIKQLQQLELHEEAKEIVEALTLSKSIYKKQDHSTRVKLLLNQVLKDYPIWKDGKSLFKYGANHLARGESFLFIHDIGNLIATTTRANFSSSHHIMIVGMSGYLGSPFRDFDENEVDTENGFYLSYLTPFFDKIRSEGDTDSWYLFDLRPLRLELIRDEYQLEVTNLIRLIKGYDMLIIIPEVSAAKHKSF